MVGSKLCLLLIGIIGLVNAAAVSRVQLDNYEKFLRSSVHGEYENALSPELEALQNTWERSGKFEGDIILDEDQIQGLLKEYAGHRNALLNSDKYWPDAVIPYVIEWSNFDETHLEAIQRAMDEIEENSCVKFVRRTTEPNNILISGFNLGCSASVGMVGNGYQIVNLQPSAVGTGCFRHGTILHELLHAAGFHHMHGTHNRNEWVEVVWDNILPGKEIQFRSFYENEVTNFDVEYDYGSVMHYSEYAYSENGLKTIVPLKPTNETLGQRNAMSRGDIRKLNLLYECYDKKQ